MADRKISELTNITGANLADDDEFALVDTSADETKAITFGEFKTALDTATGFVRITGDTMTGALDVQSTITSDGLTVDGDAKISGGSPTLRFTETDQTNLNTRITAGGGGFYIQTENDAEDSRTNRIQISHSTGDISFFDSLGSSQSFFWDASAESLGIGTSSPNSALDVAGEITLKGTSSSFASAAQPRLYRSGSSAGSYPFNDFGHLIIQSRGDGDNRDIVFATGTAGANKTVINSSGSVGIGTSSPSRKLTLHNSGANSVFAQWTNGTTGEAGSNGYLIGIDGSGNIEHYNYESTDIKIFTAGTERMRITSAGSVGIGTTSPSYPLHVSGTGDKVMAVTAGASSIAALNLGNSTNLADGGIRYDNSADALILRASNAEKMRITSDGSVGIGTSSPATKVDINNGTSNSLLTLTTNSFGGAARAGVNFQVNGFANTPSGQIAVIGDNNYSGNMIFSTAPGGTTNTPTEAMRITSSGKIGIGTDAPQGTVVVQASDAKLGVDNAGSKHLEMGIGSGGCSFMMTTGHTMAFGHQPYANRGSDSNFSEKMRLDASGNLLVGTTTVAVSNGTTSGIALTSGNQLAIGASSDVTAFFNRISTDGDIVQFRKDGTTVGSISCSNSGAYIYFGSSAESVGLGYGAGFVFPTNGSTSGSDNAKDLGSPSYRWDDIYATNATIQTSDRNEKQDIEALSDAEQRVAVAAKGLMRKFRWRDAVEAKGDAARTHFGIIAQDLQAAFAAEGLDAGDYAMFTSSTWTDEDTGEERTRMGVRYSELLAFIIAAI